MVAISSDRLAVELAAAIGPDLLWGALKMRHGTAFWRERCIIIFGLLATFDEAGRAHMP